MPASEKTPLWLGERLIDPEHWAQAREKSVNPRGEPIAAPWQAYGDGAFTAWERGADFVESRKQLRLPGLDDLLELQKAVYDPAIDSFHGYYQARVESLSDANQRRHALSLLKSGDIGALEQEFGWPSPLGQLREFGRPAMTSAGTLEQGRKGFTSAQLDRLANNPLLEVIRHNRPGGSIEGRVLFPEGAKVRSLLEQAFSDMQKEAEALKASGKIDERSAIRIAARFYRQLVSTHGLWDLNGRSAKLARDWVLGHLGLPPPAFTPSNDFELSEAELQESLLAGIARTRRNWKSAQPGCEEWFGGMRGGK